MAAGMNMNPGLKADSSNKEIEEAMKRVREAQSLISAAIEPGSEWPKRWKLHFKSLKDPLLLFDVLHVEWSFLHNLTFVSIFFICRQEGEQKEALPV